MYLKLDIFLLMVVCNFQHFFLNRKCWFVDRWVGKSLFCQKNVDMWCTIARTWTHGWRCSTCSRGEAASLGCVEDRAGHWQGPPSLHCIPLFPSLSGAMPSVQINGWTSVNFWPFQENDRSLQHGRSCRPTIILLNELGCNLSLSTWPTKYSA